MSEHYSTFTTFKANGISVHLCATEKYKTNQIGVYFRQQLEEENHTKASLIPSVLRRGTESFPSSQHLRQALDELYGASLYSDVMKRGEEQIVAFRLEVGNEKFLQDQTPLFEKAIHLLSEVITKPLLENGTFSTKYVELEKDLLHRKLDQLKDDKIRYANKRCTEEMFKNERFSLFANGSVEQLPNITSQQLYDYYQQMLMHHPIEIFLVGDLEQTVVESILNKYFTIPKRSDIINVPPTEVGLKGAHEREVIEKTKISQGKLHIGCRTNVVYQSEDYIPLVVCNGVFGGYSHSKLFRNVREKESLAYYVSSSIESHKGFMMIMAGVESSKYQKTVEIIKEQLKSLTQGDISQEELSQTKAVIINQIMESNDQPVQLMERTLHGIIGGVHRNADELIGLIEKVTVEQVQAVAQKISIDTIYFLTSQEEEGE
jgi:predicted Zn-dependent peptidase